MAGALRCVCLLALAAAGAGAPSGPQRLPLKNHGNARYTSDALLSLARSGRAQSRALRAGGSGAGAQHLGLDEGDQAGPLHLALDAVVGTAPSGHVRAAWEAAEAAIARVTAYFDAGVPAPEAVTREANATILAAIDASRRTSLLQLGGVQSFSVCIGGRPGADGALVWGDDAVQRQPGRFTQLRLEAGAWTAPLARARLVARPGAGGAVDLGCAEGCSASFDSSVSFLAAPAAAVRRLHEALPAALDCGNLTGLPDLAFRLGGAELSLPPQAYVAAVSGEVPGRLRAALGLVGAGGGCQLALAQSADEHSWVLGVPFFQRFYTTFQAAKEQAVFVAQHPAAACQPVEPGGPPPSLRTLPVRQIEAQQIRLPSAE